MIIGLVLLLVFVTSGGGDAGLYGAFETMNDELPGIVEDQGRLRELTGLAARGKTDVEGFLKTLQEHRSKSGENPDYDRHEKSIRSRAEALNDDWTKFEKSAADVLFAMKDKMSKEEWQELFSGIALE